MVGEKVTAADAGKPRNAAASDQARQRSTIGFPYMDLNDAIEVAAAIHDKVGLGSCEEDQLAAWLKQSPKSSGFRIQLSTSRMFGVTESDGGGKHKLTSLGRMVVDPKQEREGKAQAFLRVPLFRAIYDKYRGGVLPPAAALERDIEAMGVAEKQKSRARQVFERSADQAGFREHGNDRLVMPAVTAVKDSESQSVADTGGGGGDGGHSSLDPIIKGLIDRLPAPGAEWPDAERKLWLQILENSFKLVYKDSGPLA